MTTLKSLLPEMASTSILQKEFTKIVDGMKDDYYKWFRDLIVKNIERDKDEILKTNPNFYSTSGKFSKYHHPWAAFYSQHVFVSRDLWNYHMKDKPIPFDRDIPRDKLYMLPKSIWMKRVEKEAQYATDMFHGSFVAKNTAKFEGIVKNKKIVEMKHNINSRNLTGNLIIKCEDGSGFRVSFSIVAKYSNKGKFFNQYPTRFHEVIFSDGTKMKNPSEAKMKKEF